MSKRTAYLNIRLLDPATGLDALGGLLTVDDKIWDFGPKLFSDGVPDGVTRVDGKGACLSPGLIDMQVFLGESMSRTSDAAAAGGVTSIAVMPDTNPILDDIALVEHICRRGRTDAPVNVYPYAAATKQLAGQEMTELHLLRRAGAVGFASGRHAISNARVMQRLMTYARMDDVLILQHAEEPDLSAEGCATDGEFAARLGLPGVPAEAEVIMIERDLRLAELTGARYHVGQVSTAASVEAIRKAKSRGIRVTCGTAPHYFALNELAIEQYRTFARTSPPLRPESDRKAIVEGLRDGTIDVIVSSHDPKDEESKRLPFTQAEPGIAGIETMLPLALELHHSANLPLLTMLKALTCRPAGLLGLPAGKLEKGAPADLILFDLHAAHRLDADALHSQAKNNPFDGRPVQGKLLQTIVAGETIFTA